MLGCGCGYGCDRSRLTNPTLHDMSFIRHKTRGKLPCNFNLSCLLCDRSSKNPVVSQFEIPIEKRDLNTSPPLCHPARSRRIHAVCGLQRLRFATRCNDRRVVQKRLSIPFGSWHPPARHNYLDRDDRALGISVMDWVGDTKKEYLRQKKVKR